MIRHLAAMHTCLTTLRHTLTLLSILMLLWHPALSADEELWARPVAVGGSWQLYRHGIASAGLPLELTVVQHFGRLQAIANDGRYVSGTIDGHRIRFDIHCAVTTRACIEERYDGVLHGAYIDGTARRGPQRDTFRAHIDKRFSLTFDDGPLADGTSQVLAQLAQLTNPAGEPIKAAFFFVAEAPVTTADRVVHYAPFELWREKGSIVANPELTQQVIGAGHFVGNHTWHHSWSWWPWQSDSSAIEEEINGWEAAARNSGVFDYARIYRPPYLSRFTEHARISAALGYSAISGHTTGDAEPGATLDSVQQRALTALEYCTDVPCPLIFHDTRTVTQQHLTKVVEFLQKLGFALVDFSPPPQPHVAQQDAAVATLQY